MGPLNQHLGADALPGMGPEIVQPVRAPFLMNQEWFLMRGVLIDKNSVDVGNVGNTHTLRAGLVLVKVSVGANAGKFVPLDHADAPAAGDTDGDESFVILAKDVNLYGKDCELKDMSAPGVYAGIVDEAAVILSDEAYLEAVWDMKLVLFHNKTF